MENFYFILSLFYYIIVLLRCKRTLYLNVCMFLGNKKNLGRVRNKFILKKKKIESGHHLIDYKYNLKII